MSFELTSSHSPMSQTGGKRPGVGDDSSVAMVALALSAAATAGAAALLPPALLLPALSLSTIVLATIAGIAAPFVPAARRRPALMFAATLGLVGIAAGMVGDPDQVANFFK